MGGRFDDSWLDETVKEETEGEFVPSDPFEGLNKRQQDLFFRMLDIIPDDKREEAMDYFVDHPKKIKEVVAVISAKKKIVESRDAEALRTIFDEHRIHFEEPSAISDEEPETLDDDVGGRDEESSANNY